MRASDKDLLVHFHRILRSWNSQKNLFGLAWGQFFVKQSCAKNGSDSEYVLAIQL